MGEDRRRTRHWSQAAVQELAEAVARTCGGHLSSWELALEPTSNGRPPRLVLWVTARTPAGHRLALYPLSDEGDGAIAAPAGAPGHPQAPVAAVRRATFCTLFGRCGARDPEPLLDYLRCCGVRILD